MQMPEEREYRYQDPSPPAEWQPQHTEYADQQYYQDAPPPAGWQPEYTDQQYYQDEVPSAGWQPEYTEQSYSREAPAPASAASGSATSEFTEQQLEALERAQDPFRAIRKVVYALFGVVSVAGVGVSVMQMGDSPGQSLQNIVVNVVLGGAVLAAFNFDTTVVQKKIKDKTRKDLQNPYLKGDSEFFFEKNKKMD